MEEKNQNNHTHSNSNCNCNNKNCNKNINSSKKQYLMEKIIFIPIILIKIYSTFYLYEKYFCKFLKNNIDIEYSQKSIFIFIIYLTILYIISIISSPTNTDVDKYISLIPNKKPKKELIKLKQKYVICDFCHKEKFIRNSHCRICNNCISFRDHHCSFVTNCVGFNNIQYFLNFCLWGLYGIIFGICSYFRFNYINLSLFTFIIIKIDFLANIFFTLSLFGIIFRTLYNIYNNRTFIENTRQIGIEKKCPFFDIYKKENKNMSTNFYNIGFLNHFFYLIGPSLLHFILPLPKFKNYILDENCPIFMKTKIPDGLELIKYYEENEEGIIKKKIDMDSDPDTFIKMCHINYDGKIII